MSVRLNMTENHASITRHAGTTPTARVTPGSHDGAYPYPPSAWVCWEERPSRGISREILVFFNNTNDIDHLLGQLTRLKGELADAERKYRETAPSEG